MSDTPQRETVEQLAEEYVSRLRRGERPAVAEYAERFPEHADEIRDLFPALLLMEQVAPDHDESHPDQSQEYSHPAQLGDYRLLREVGRGGMGVVYEAEQVSLGRHVALKVLPSHALLDPRQLQRFHREARAAARLHHTNIVPVYGVGEDAGLHYYVMQFIPGLGLDQVLDELRRLRSPKVKPADGIAGRAASGLLSGEFTPPARINDSAPRTDSVTLPGQSGSLSETGRQYWRSVARIGAQIASALEYAHQQGVVHRDIKPSNLLLDAHGSVWVADFGLAKASADSGDALTRTGDVLGTLRYMAPERFRGTADVRGDVYSLGLTLYEMLTLRPAFSADDRESLISKVMHDTPPAPRLLDPRVPRDLETVVLKATAREPESRYATPGELADDLQRFIDDRPVRARRITAAERLSRWCRRNRGLAASLLGSAILLVLFAVGATGAAVYFRHQETLMDDARGKAVTASQEADAARLVADKGRRDAQRRLYLSQMAQAQQAWTAPRGRRHMRELLEAWIPAASEPDRRGWEWYYLNSLLHPNALVLTQTPAKFAAWSRDGKRVAVGDAGGYLRVFDGATGEVRCTTKLPEVVVELAWSADGARLATSHQSNTVHVWDAATGRSLKSKSNFGGRIAWGSKWIAATLRYGGKDVALWDPDTNEEKTLQGHTLPVNVVAWSPDGSRLASGGNDQSTFVWDVESQTTIHMLKAASSPVSCIAWHAEGVKLATGHDDRTVSIWEAGTGRRVMSLFPHPQGVRSLSWAATGDRLATCGNDEVIHVHSVGAQGAGRLGSIYEEGSLAAWHPTDDRMLAAGSRGVRVWTWGKTQDGRYFSSNRRDVDLGAGAALAWSPDGRRLARSFGTFRINIWDAVDDRELKSLISSRGGVTDLTWSADGRSLASIGRGGTMLVFDPDSGERRRSHDQPSAGNPGRIAFEPGGDQLAFGAIGFGLRIGNRANNEVKSLLGPDNGLFDLAWRPDRRRLAACLVSGSLKVWDTSTWKEVPFDLGGETRFHRVRWSPDGQLMAAVPSGTERSDLIEIWNADAGTRIATLRGHTDLVVSLAWHPDGARLASGGKDGVVRIWDVATGDHALTLAGHGSPIYGLAWDPTGRRLASASLGDTVIVWDATPGYNAAANGRH